MSLLMKGILIGILFGLPVGAVGAMTIQRTLSFGFLSGVLSGFGSSAADCLYACACAFGLSVVSDFLLLHQTIINTLGGSLILFIGIKLIVKCDRSATPKNRIAGNAGIFLSSFAVGITNPTAILSFLFAFSYFDISGCRNATEAFFLVTGVFCGTMFWWVVLAAAVSLLQSRAVRHRRTMNVCFGMALIVFSLVIFCRLIFDK